MRDNGIDKGLVREFDDSKRDLRGQGKGFFGFRKMFRDYLTKLNVPFYDHCCPALTGDVFPVRDNDGVLESFDGTVWSAIDLGTFTATDIALDDGLVSDLALKLGADGNNGIYGVSDTDMGFAVEGVHVGGANAAGLYANAIAEMTAASGVTVDGVLVKDGGVTITKGTITQSGTKTTTVVANQPAGVITTVALTDAADASFSFTLTNSFIAATSVVLPTTNMNAGNGHAHIEIVPGSGSASVTVTNVGTAAFNSAIKIGFLVV